MKRILLACSLVGLIAAANAQPAPSDHPMPMERCMMMHHRIDPAEHAAHLQKTLQLTDEQTTKVKKIFEDSAQQGKALVQKYQPQLDAFHTDMKKLHEQMHAQINGVLTPKQQQALDAQHKKHGTHKPMDAEDEHQPGEPAPAK
ncbi:MAG TPA: hypothetical protein VGK97_05605 [Spongiibacteraceae bacterium]|jgi:Spy/CpxP family protein refolding chaperone